MKNSNLNEVLGVALNIGGKILGGALTSAAVYDALSSALGASGNRFLQNHINELQVTLEQLQNAVRACVYTYPGDNLTSTRQHTRGQERVRARILDFSDIVENSIFSGNVSLYQLMDIRYNVVNRVPISAPYQRLPILFAESIALNDRSIDIFRKFMSVENITAGDYRDFTTCNRSKASIIKTVIDLFRDYMISQLETIEQSYGARGPDVDSPEDRKNYVEIPDWRRDELTFRINEIKNGINNISDAVHNDAHIEFIHDEPALVGLDDMVADAIGGLWNVFVSDPFDLLLTLTGHGDKKGAGAVEDDCGKVPPGILTGKRFTD